MSGDVEPPMGPRGRLEKPPTTRIGGAGSAHATAVGVVAVLVTLVWVGWSGRESGRPSSAPDSPREAEVIAGDGAPPVGVKSEPEGVPAEPVRPATPDAAGRAPGGPILDVDHELYALVATVGDRRHVGLLRQVSDGHLHAIILVPFAAPDPRVSHASLQIDQLWASSLDQLEPLGAWQLAIGAVSRGVAGSRAASGAVLRVTAPPAPNDAAGRRLVQRGYTMTVKVERLTKYAVLDADLELLPVRSPAPAGTRWQISGDDGILGWVAR